MNYFLIIIFLLGKLSAPVWAQDTVASSRSKPLVFYGTASFYSHKFVGRKTANGEIFSQNKMTAACNRVPLGTWIKVTNLRNKRSVVVKVNDRLHAKTRRLVDLTHAAARKLGFINSGIIRVRVDVMGKTNSAN